MSVLTSGRVLPGDHALNEHALMRRITLRVVPLTVLIYLIAIIDRANVGFAKLQMVSDLHMTEQLYGLASSLFFIGYLSLEIPSALAVHRFGARAWFARILLTWGLFTVAGAWVTSGSMFAALRFLSDARKRAPIPVLFITSRSGSRKPTAPGFWAFSRLEAHSETCSDRS